MKNSDCVILKTFNNSIIPESHVDDSGNYWKLIGLKGKIVAQASEYNFPYNNRVLVKFFEPIKEFGLNSHNPIRNSLWILKDDLEVILIDETIKS